jgi:hypothetical protein
VNRARDVLLVSLVVMQAVTLAIVGHAYYKARETIGAFRSAFGTFNPAAVLPQPTSAQPPRPMADPAKPQEYEYITLAPPDSVFDETMNRLGHEGWELVSSRRASSGGKMAYEVILRRVKRAGQKETTSALEQLNTFEDEQKQTVELLQREAAEAAAHKEAEAQAAAARENIVPPAQRGTLKGGNLAATTTTH